MHREDEAWKLTSILQIQGREGLWPGSPGRGPKGRKGVSDPRDVKDDELHSVRTHSTVPENLVAQDIAPAGAPQVNKMRVPHFCTAEFLVI